MTNIFKRVARWLNEVLFDATSEHFAMEKIKSESRMGHARRIEAILPITWGNVLMYGDRSEINDDELAALEAWLASCQLKREDILDCKNDQIYVMRHAAWAWWPIADRCQMFVFYQIEWPSPDDQVKDDSGATLTTYAMLACLIAVLVVMVRHFGGVLS